MIAVILSNIIELLKIVLKLIEQRNEKANDGVIEIVDRYDKIIKNLIVENEHLRKKLEAANGKV